MESHDLSKADISLIEVSTRQATELFDCTDRWIQQRAKEGHFKPVRHGRYRLVDLCRAFRAADKEETARARGTGAENRLRDARAREVELRTARLDRTVIDIEEAQAAVETMAGMYVAELDGFPARMARELNVDRVQVQTFIDSSRQRLAARFIEVGFALRDGQPVAGSDEEDDA